MTKPDRPAGHKHSSLKAAELLAPEDRTGAEPHPPPAIAEEGRLDFETLKRGAAERQAKLQAEREAEYQAEREAEREARESRGAEWPADEKSIRLADAAKLLLADCPRPLMERPGDSGLRRELIENTRLEDMKNELVTAARAGRIELIHPTLGLICHGEEIDTDCFIDRANFEIIKRELALRVPGLTDQSTGDAVEIRAKPDSQPAADHAVAAAPAPSRPEDIAEDGAAAPTHIGPDPGAVMAAPALRSNGVAAPLLADATNSASDQGTPGLTRREKRTLSKRKMYETWHDIAREYRLNANGTTRTPTEIAKKVAQDPRAKDPASEKCPADSSVTRRLNEFHAGWAEKN